MLEPDVWFENVHDHDGGDIKVGGIWIPRFNAGLFVWILAPVVARILIEELR